VFERFTEPSQRLVALAQQESRLLQHHYVGTEHLLIASTEVDEQLTAALAELGVTTESARGQVARMVAPTGSEPSADASLTPEATQALEASRREALQLGHDYVAPAHIVMGLLATHDGTMPVLLTRLAVNAETLRLRMVSLFDGVTAPAVDDESPAFRPMCSTCHAPLDRNVRLVTIDAGGEPIRLACCGTCGTVLPALPSA
jgi:ATP-dependent Clp protease ATP-binding subunit ClpC